MVRESSWFQVFRELIHWSTSTSRCLLLYFTAKSTFLNEIWTKLLYRNCLNLRASAEDCVERALFTTWPCARWLTIELNQIWNKLIASTTENSVQGRADLNHRTESYNTDTCSKRHHRAAHILLCIAYQLGRRYVVFSNIILKYEQNRIQLGGSISL